MAKDSDQIGSKLEITNILARGLSCHDGYNLISMTNIPPQKEKNKIYLEPVDNKIRYITADMDEMATITAVDLGKEVGFCIPGTIDELLALKNDILSVILKRGHILSDISACRDFLNKYTHLPDKKNTKELIKKLELIENIARKIAPYIYAYKKLREKSVSGTRITFEEIDFYRNEQQRELKKHLDAILILTKKAVFQCRDMHAFNVDTTLLVRCKQPNCGEIRQLTLPSLKKQIKKFSKELEKCIKPKINLSSRKRTKGAIRSEAIGALTDAWVEITGKAPQKRNRNPTTQKLQGEFHSFMEDGLKLFNTNINTEEAIREAYPYFLKNLVNNSALTIIRNKINKRKTPIKYPEFFKLVSTELNKNPLFPDDAKKETNNILKVFWEEWKGYVGELVSKNNQ